MGVTWTGSSEGFEIETIWLSKRALERAGEIEGPRPCGVIPGRRRVSSVREYATRRDPERLIPL